MRILLDECVPLGLKNHLPGHDVCTVVSMGWAGKKNGELLTLAVGANFEIFITVDQNLKFQQNLKGISLTIMVLIAPSIRLADLVPLTSLVLAKLPSIRPGDFLEIR